MEGTIQQLFEGHHMNYIECINVDYKSTRKESFYGMHGFINTHGCIRMETLNLTDIYIVCQIFSLMSKVVVMFTLHLTSTLKWNVLRATTDIMPNNMACRFYGFLTFYVLFPFIAPCTCPGVGWGR